PRRSSESIITTTCAVRVMLLLQWIARGTGGATREARCVGAVRRMKGSMGACRSAGSSSSRVRDSRHGVCGYGRVGDGVRTLP
ncbi:hypothetical protein B0H13DRAFT_2172373, partial [Mycena leptocephala]